MSLPFSYRHLYYFWVVAKEGGIARGAERLGMAVQTVSSQVRELERALGHALLQASGRRLVLTEAGSAAMQQAEQIFQLGEQLPDLVRNAATAPAMRLVVGVSQGLPKLVVRSLMEPVMAEPTLRLLCQEGAFEDLLAELALHRLDVLLSDRPPPANENIKVYSHPLGTSRLAWYASRDWQTSARKGFPGSLEKVPVLMPSRHGAVRALLDRWFERHAIRPRVVGEFDDSALLKTFGSSGMGVFPAAERVEDELIARYGVKPVGRCDDVEERFFAIGTERKVTHPLVRLLIPGRS